MFKKILLSTFLVLNFSDIINAAKVKYTKEIQMKDQYNDYLKIHGKKYNTDNDYNTHFKIFHENLQNMKHYREEDKFCKLYLTKNSDLEINAFYDTCKGNIIPSENKNLE